MKNLFSLTTLRLIDSCSNLFFRSSSLTALISLLCLASSTAASSPGFDTLVNYDTAWTFVYDGGRLTTGLKASVLDDFGDAKALSNGDCILVGNTSDTLGNSGFHLVKLNNSGKIVWKKLLRGKTISQYNARSILIAKNGDFILGGSRFGNPWILRTDTIGNIKWATWYYDSVNNNSLLQGNGTINCVRETKRGTIICAGGDNFTDVNYVYGNVKYDYAAVLQFDSTGKIISYGEAGGQSGYYSGGFDIEETSTGNYILSGNQSILYMDSTVNHQIWEKKYIFQLDGVGSEVNNIVRCKMLHDGSLMVAGQAYEGNCWTKFKQLYYDAWWSPISYAYGTNTAWDTAGFQGGSDAIYDFTQLDNGNLVFIGSRAFGPGGIWTFVTDSTGKRLLWEKQTPIPYQTDPGSSARGYSVCATPDGGFTVAGELVLTDALGGHNAMAAHFIPKPVSAVSRTNSALKSTHGFNVHIIGSRLIVSNNAPLKSPGVITLFDITGKRIASQAVGTFRETPLQFDISKLSFGTYFVRVKSGSAAQTMKVVY